MLRGLLVTAGVVVGILALVTGLLWVFQRSLIYLPQGAPGAAPAGAEDVVLRTDDGLDLAAWWFPAAAADAPAVLVANGNGGHRGLREPLARALHDAGLSVLLFDYRGYGGNPGDPSEEGLARDVRAARATAAAVERVDDAARLTDRTSEERNTPERQQQLEAEKELFYDAKFALRALLGWPAHGRPGR